MMVNDNSFLGYGSPQALEKAITAEEDDHFIVRENLLFAGVCSDLPQEEVVARMARRVCGTSGGWQLCESVEQGKACEEKLGYKHYIFEC